MKTKIQNHFSNNYKAFYGKYLPEVKKVGGSEYVALCPFHDDSKPSFNFNDLTGQYYCHGCGKKGDIIHFYGKIKSLNTKQDFGKILSGIANDFGIAYEEPHIVKTYDYLDESGNLLFQVVRMEPKSFRQRRSDGNGGWKWNLNGTRRVLYNLPEVLGAQEVLVVEGEKDADNVSALGFCATTSPMGTGKWLPEYGEALKDKDVILIPDNDNQGREHMANVGASLKGVANSLKWLELPDLPSKGDVSDFISRYENKEEALERISIMLESAEPYKAPEKKTLDDMVMTFGEFCSLELPKKETLLFPWLKEQSITLVSGWRGVGKTFFALGILDAISKGKPFGPWDCNKSVPTLFFDAEMPCSDTQERGLGFYLHEGERKNPIKVHSEALANLHGLPRANLGSEAWRSKMKQILLTHHIKLWVIDNLASVTGGLDENLKKDYDPINQWILELRFTGIATMLLHHVGKEGQQRGTSAREDNLDVSIILKHPNDFVPEDGCRFITSFSKNRVSHKDLKLLGDTEFRLDENYQWTWGNVRGEMKKEVLRLIGDGADVKSIIESLNITKGYISQIRNKAIKDNLITPKGKLTQSGWAVVYE